MKRHPPLNSKAGNYQNLRLLTKSKLRRHNPKENAHRNFVKKSIGQQYLLSTL